jgi:regulator of nucleoside diphosphate kinase
VVVLQNKILSNLTDRVRLEQLLSFLSGMKRRCTRHVSRRSPGGTGRFKVEEIIAQPDRAEKPPMRKKKEQPMLNQQTVKSNGAVVITEIDHDRLTHLIESPRYRQTHPLFVRSLKEELDRGRVVGQASVPKEIVTMHSQVRINDLEDGAAETYTLVYPDEADIEQGKLSVLAPMGTALLGTRVGQVIKFAVPAGVRRLKIVQILYQPEAAGDLHL